jgi:cyclophilin family peptidyl-prolyl cis-trans isomerase
MNELTALKREQLMARRQRKQATVAAKSTMEPLEVRRMLSVGVTNIVMDNRGQAIVTFNQNIRVSSVSASTVQVYTAGSDGMLGTADDVLIPEQLQSSGKTLYVSTNTGLGQFFRVVLTGGSGGIKSTRGSTLTGNTGPRGRGGNYDYSAVAQYFTARFSTSAGIINVALSTQTGQTNQNFINYANAGAYDGTFFNAKDSAVLSSASTLLGGGFRVDTGSGSLGTVAENAPVPLELGGGSNVRGTVAMYHASGPDSATNQFFFNTKSNPALDTAAGGYAVFGKVADSASLKVLDSLARTPKHDLSSTGPELAEVPLRNYNGAFNSLNQLLIVYRVSLQLGVAPTVLSSPVVGTGTGSISGTVYVDNNLNGVMDNVIPREFGTLGRQVFLDTQNTGSYVTGDPIASTDANGVYTFSNLKTGSYTVRLLPENASLLTSPANRDYVVSLANGQAVTGEDFGTQDLIKTQTDGKLLASGLVNGSASAGTFDSLVLRRFNPDGSLDASFGSNGTSPALATQSYQSFTKITSIDEASNGNLTLHLSTYKSRTNTTIDDLIVLSSSGVIISGVPLT